MLIATEYTAIFMARDFLSIRELTHVFSLTLSAYNCTQEQLYSRSSTHSYTLTLIKLSYDNGGNCKKLMIITAIIKQLHKLAIKTICVKEISKNSEISLTIMYRANYQTHITKTIS